MMQTYRALHHNGGMVVKYPGCFLDYWWLTTAKPTISFNSSNRCRYAGKIGNSKSHRNISHYAFPQSLRGSKDDWASAKLLPQRGSVFIRFRRHDHFQYRIDIAGWFFAHQTFAFNAQSLPRLAARRIVSKMLSFSVGNGGLSTQRRFPRANQDNFQILATISNSGCGAI